MAVRKCARNRFLDDFLTCRQIEDMELKQLLIDVEPIGFTGCLIGGIEMGNEYALGGSGRASIRQGIV